MTYINRDWASKQYLLTRRHYLRGLATLVLGGIILLSLVAGLMGWWL